MKKIILLLLISFAAQSQTLIKPKQIEGSTAGSVLTTTGTGTPTWTTTVPIGAIPSLPYIPTSSVSAFQPTVSGGYVPYSGATTSLNLGANTFSLGGNFYWNLGGSNNFSMVPYPTATTIPASYLALGATTPTTTNYLFLGDGTNNVFNAPQGLFLRSFNVNLFSGNSKLTTNGEFIQLSGITSTLTSAGNNITSMRVLGNTLTFPSGTTAIQRGVLISPDTYIGPGIITEPVGLDVSAATNGGSGMAFTRSWAIVGRGSANITGSLVVGTSGVSPISNFYVVGSVAGQTALFQNNSASASNFIEFSNTANNVNSTSGYAISTNIPRVGYFRGQSSGVTLANSTFGIAGSAVGIAADAVPIIFSPNGVSSLTNAMVINTSNNVGIGTGSTVISSSAKLEVTSTTQGFLPPRMTATQGSAISSPAAGLLIYVTNTNGTFTAVGWWGYNGATWEKLNN